METKRKKLISLLFNMGRAMKDHFGHEKEEAFSLLHIETLAYIADHDLPSMKHIAGHLCITPASTSSLVDGLVEMDLLERVFEKDDRRLVKLKITEKGKGFMKKGFDHASGKMEAIFEELDDKDIDDFIRILENFTKIINSKKMIK